jgi:hypothetical protein
MVRPKHIGEVTTWKSGASASGASAPKPPVVLQQRDRLTDIAKLIRQAATTALALAAFPQQLYPVLVDRIYSSRISRAGRGFGLLG